MNVLVTGATGFVGRALIDRLNGEGLHHVKGSVRKLGNDVVGSSQTVAVGDISATTDWSEALEEVEVVVHLAARAHVLDASDDQADFHRVNVEGAVNLAQQALKSGVKRFVFISSIGVNGAYTENKAFDESSPNAPHAIYAESKRSAEQMLLELVQGSLMELVIIRPPLVYSAKAPGNFQRLLKLVKSGIPLPFAMTNNKRSMVSLGNLTDFISLCIDHPAAANELFLISDGDDVSTRQIVSLLAEGMGRRVWLLPFPASIAQVGARMLGKSSLYTQLFRSLVVDSSKARELLGWVPRQSTSVALKEAGMRYKSGRSD
ncbi:NAD-dependent epimerase/dehydratase family protein [Pseudomonas sp. NFX98]|uniref:NAD-dependent epimerase/dehydratase family protein n=1 Tax=Pseudomonas sp. NFX98 TaxID=3399122 RepID=UPI0039FCBACE